MATVISGKQVSLEVQEKIKQRVQVLKETYNVIPLLAIVQVGNREDSNVYIRSKVKMAQDVGMKAEHHKLSSDTTEKQVSVTRSKCSPRKPFDVIPFFPLPLNS